MKSIHTKEIQYTVRKVRSHVDKALRRKARQENRSLNSVLVEALEEKAGLNAAGGGRYVDLDSLAGLWQDDPDFDQAIALQDQVDPGLWE